MRQTYLQHSKRRKKIPLGIIATIVVVFVAVGAHYLFPQTVSSIAHTLARPLLSAQASVSSSGFIGSIKSKVLLEQEVAALTQENQRLRLSLIRSTLLQTENEELSALLNRAEAQERVLAAVLTRPPQSRYDTFTIDIGANRSVSVGDVVLGPGDVPLGTVIEVYGGSSLVELYSSPGRVTDVRINDDERTTAQARGKGLGNFIIEMPRGIAVSVGEPIILSGITSRVLGIVGAVEVKETDPFQSVLLSSPVSMFTLRFVEVERTLAL